MAGTYFDPAFIVVSEQGNMGDVIGVNLRDLAARQLLIKEKKLDAALASTAWNKLDAAVQAIIEKRMADLENFTVSVDDKAFFSTRDTTSTAKQKMRLIVDKDKKIVSRTSADPDCTTEAEFKDTGVLFFVPVIQDKTTDSKKDESEKLRLGNTLADKDIAFFFHYFDKAANEPDNKPLNGWGLARLKAKDFNSSPNVFFGDRPLDNPGYSKFTLAGEVKVGSKNVLDVYRVEQRLKYLGFPAMGTGSPKPSLNNNIIQNFKVNGVFEEEEKAALKLFEKVVRYSTGTGSVTITETTTTKDSNYAIATATESASYSATATSKNTGQASNVSTTAIASSVKATATPLADPVAQAAEEQRVLAIAVQRAIETAGSKAAQMAINNAYASTRFTSNFDGADGKLEAPTNDPKGDGKKTTDWLNAYNAPHWMNIGPQMQFKYGIAQSAYTIPGWNNKQGLETNTQVESYGVSWMRDLLVAASKYAPEALLGNSSVTTYESYSWTNYHPRNTFMFNGAVDANYGFTPNWNPQVEDGKSVKGQHYSHDLGMAFDLGVSGYIGGKAQGDKNELPTIGSATSTVKNFVKNLENTPFDPLDPTKGTLYTHIPNIADYLACKWNYDNAMYLSGLLPAITGKNMNDQVSALRDALSLYAVVRDSTWGAVNIVSDKNASDETKIRAALFGDGSKEGALISTILIGITTANDYPNIHEVLQRLGISDGYDLEHHFHIYLNPPELQEIIPLPRNLLADASSGSLAGVSTLDATFQTEAQGLIDYAQTLTDTGEELMFTMDVPYVPAQQTPIVLAQAATPGAIPQPDYILKDCQETETTGDPRSAMRSVDPAGSLAVYIGNRDNRSIYSDQAAMAAIKITLLEDTKHGELTSGFDSTGRIGFGYDPEPDYVGKDRAVFMAEFEGKRYKIILELHVFKVVDEYNSTCPEPKLIKVKKPSTGDSGFGAGYNLASVSVTFADLEGAAIGQTTSSTITLDTNAANHNWFIDPTPGQNEEYLPTSNPNEWVAKAGSDAAGKMDMLSVLLHEYGHTLGINHSPDSHDYMATTLTPGVRRLPTAEELALMQRLVGRVKEEMVAGSVGAATSAGSGQALAANDSRTFAEFVTLSPSPSPASGRGEFERFVRRF